VAAAAEGADVPDCSDLPAALRVAGWIGSTLVIHPSRRKHRAMTLPVRI